MIPPEPTLILDVCSKVCCINNAVAELTKLGALWCSAIQYVEQLATYFGPSNQQSYVRAYPAVNKNVPLYILGSSTDSAHLAARKGLPYVFAGHFAPQQMKEAMSIYKELFEPSEVLQEPYMIVCLNAIVADTDEQAYYLASTQAQVMVSITRGKMQPVQPPTDDLQIISWWLYRLHFTSSNTNHYLCLSGSKVVCLFICICNYCI